MTTATRPLPDHGTRARYLRGCRCQPCGDAHYQYMSRYRLNRHRNGTLRTDAGPAQTHVQNLLAAGWQRSDIARAADCSATEIRTLAAERYRTVHRDIAQRVLAVPVADPPVGRYIDPTGTMRRVRALVAIGHPICRIAAAAGLNKSPLAVVARGERPRIEPRTALAVAAVYRTMARTPGTSPKARAMAARNHWPSPVAWDHDIDDPAAQPDIDHIVINRRRAKADPVDEDRIARLTVQGLTTAQIADLLGCNPRTVIRARRRAEQQEAQVAA